MTLVLVLVTMAAVAFTAYWLGYGSRDAEVRQLRQQLHQAREVANIMVEVSYEQQAEMAALQFQRDAR